MTWYITRASRLGCLRHIAPTPCLVSKALLPVRNFSNTSHSRTDKASSPPPNPATSTLSAADAAAHLLTTLSSTPVSRRQLLDANQLQRLSLTLNRRHLYPLPSSPDTSPPSSQHDLISPTTTLPNGTPLPPGYHLAYFTPAGLESELGPDGTDRTFNAPAPFTRRMWAGGRMRWFDRGETHGDAAAGAGGGESGRGRGLRTLKVGEVAEERTRLVDAKAKRSRDGGEMVLVDVEKEFWGEDGLVCVDQRSWIFRPELEAASSTEEVVTETKVIRGPSTFEDITVDGEELPHRHHTWSPVALFRFSALTFNGHKIHYDQSWSRAIEDHSPGVVVHGPLNLLCMLDYFRDVVASGKLKGGSPENSSYTGPGSEGVLERTTRVKEIEYRALSPLYAGQRYSIRAELRRRAETVEGGNGGEEPGRMWDMHVEREGTLCMKATITTAGP